MLSITSVQLSETLSSSGQAQSGLAGLQPANSTPIASFYDLIRRAPPAEGFHLPAIEGESLPRSGNPLPLPAAPDPSLDAPQMTVEIIEEAAIESAPLAFSLRLSNTPAAEASLVNHAAHVPAASPSMGIQVQALPLATSVPLHPAHNSLVDNVVVFAAVAGSQPKQPETSILPATTASRSALPHDAVPPGRVVPEPSALPGAVIANTSQPVLEMPLDVAASDKALKSLYETLSPLTASTVPGSSAAATASAVALQPLVSAASGSVAVSTPGAVPVYSADIDIAAADGNWADAFSDRVLMIAGKQFQRAEVRLHPAELGSVQIRISVEDNATSISFTAQNAVARDAIEQALPRLRELFTESGLTLGDATVSENGARQYDRDDALATATAEVDAKGESDADDAWQDTIARRALRAANQLIDTFA